MEFYHLFPFDKVRQESRLIIYGAGEVGQWFLAQLQHTRYAQVVAIADKAWQKYSPMAVPLIGPDELPKLSYDQIVISIEDVDIAKSVAEMLIQEMGIAQEKIVLGCASLYERPTYFLRPGNLPAPGVEDWNGFPRLGLVVWGTGDQGNYVSNRLAAFNSIINQLSEGHACCGVACYLDSDARKHGRRFFGRPVKNPSKFNWQENEWPVLLAVEHDQDLVKEMESRGYARWKRDQVSSLGLTEDANVRSFLRLQDLNDWLLAQKAGKEEAIKGYWHKKVDKSEYICALESLFGRRMEKVLAWFPEPREMPKHEYRQARTLCLVTDRFHNGGGQRVISELMPIYQARGYRVILVTRTQADASVEYPVPPGVERVVLGEHTSRQEVNAIWHDLLARCEAPLVCLHLALSIIALYDMLYVRSLGVPVLMTIHNGMTFCFDTSDGIQPYLETHKFFSGLVPLSRADAAFWQAQGCRCKLIPNPVSCDVAKVTAVKRDKNMVLWVGRFHEQQKQIFDLPDILALVVRKHPEAHLVFVGEVPDDEEGRIFREEFRRRGLEQHVEFAGYQKKVETYYQKASVLLMTSKYEAFPMVVCESKAFGVPLVLYELPWLELLQDGKGYIAVRQKDKQAAAQAVVNILQKPELQARLASEARESIKPFQEYDLGAAWDEAFRMALIPVGQEIWKNAKEEADGEMAMRILYDHINELEAGSARRKT